MSFGEGKRAKSSLNNMNTDSDRQIKLGVSSSLAGLIVLFASLLLLAASSLPESSTEAALIIYLATFAFVFIIAPLFYFVGLILGFYDLLRRKSEKWAAICAVSLNALLLVLTAGGWILLIIRFLDFLIKAASAWH
jgi:hypothetical protein